MTSQFNLAGPTINTDRYEHYKNFLETEPTLWYSAANTWMLFRHADVSRLARSDMVCTNYLIREKVSDEMMADDPALQEIVGTISRWMIYNEAPIHPRLRSFMNQTFDRTYIERVRARISQVLETRLAALKGRTSIDFITDIAHPVPAEILAIMLGLDEINLTDFLRWSDAIADFMQDFVVSPVPNKAIAANTAKQLLEMKAALRKAIAIRKESPRDDLLSDLAVATAGEQATITEEELMLQLIHLIFGGHKIPQFVLSNTLNLLLLNPQYLQLGKETMYENVVKAVDESMRLESPIQFITRHAVSDFTMGDKQIRKGDSIYLMLGAANRDPAVYPEPDRFMPGEAKRKGMHYGTGPHVCIGAALASVTIAEILTHFLKSLSSIAPEYDIHHPDWTKNDTFHGITTMPMKVSYL